MTLSSSTRRSCRSDVTHSRRAGGAFLAGAVAVGLPYFGITYSEVSLPSTLVAPGLLIVAAAAAVLRAKAGLGFVRSVVVAALAVTAVVLLRIVIETAADPTTHNLWPFEVVIAAGVGALAALTGALPGIGFEWLARMRRR